LFFFDWFWDDLGQVLSQVLIGRVPAIMALDDLQFLETILTECDSIESARMLLIREKSQLAGDQAMRLEERKKALERDKIAMADNDRVRRIRLQREINDDREKHKVSVFDSPRYK
jgi:hypothetical protein